MTVRVNLLPASLLRRRRARGRRRVWIAVCLGLAAAQGVAFSFVARRAHETRLYRNRAAQLTASLKQEKTERDAARLRAARLAHDVALAERLREKHYWSRWLGNLSLLTPERVMLTTVATEPPQFAGVQSLGPRAAAGPGDAATAAGPREVRLRGAARRHDDLIALLKALNSLPGFQSVQLLEAKRTPIGEKDAIGFALACDW